MRCLSFCLWRRKWQSIPVFLPGESHGERGALQATVHRVPKRQTQLKWLSLLVSGLFLVTSCLQCCSMYQNFIPFEGEWYSIDVYSTFCLSFCPSTDIWVASTLWLLWRMLWNWCLSPCFQFFCVYTEKWNCWIKWELILCLIFWEAIIVFPTLVAPKIKLFQFFLFFDNSHPDEGEVVSHCGYNYYFLVIINVEHLFICLLTTLYLLWRNSIQAPCPFFNWVVWIFVVEF